MRIGVYGLGRFGYMWAGLLARRFDVRAHSRDSTREVPDGVRRVSAHELAEVDVLFLCVAISAMDEVCRWLGGSVGRGTLVMDTCSVKVYPSRVMDEHLPPGVDILATHPMFGPDSASNGVEGLPLVLCPVRVGDARIAEWTGVFTDMGLCVHCMSPEEHDREAAFTQGITHFVGRILADMELRESRIATVGYESLLQIIEQTCNDSWQLFLDLQHHNPYTSQMREQLRRSIDKMLRKLR